MMRLVLFLVVIAAVAAFFTRPDEAKLREGADAVLSNPESISQGVQSVGAAIAGDRSFSDYYVVTRYVVTLDNRPVVNCWGAFTQVQCARVEQASS